MLEHIYFNKKNSNLYVLLKIEVLIEKEKNYQKINYY